jgi:hypothetical protein
LVELKIKIKQIKNMKRFSRWSVCVLLIFSISVSSYKADATPKKTKVTGSAKFSSRERLSQYIEEIYNSAGLGEAGLELAVFQKAVTGYFNMKANNLIPQYSSVVTIVDLTKSSCTKRMWIVDVVDKALLLNTWVAHGNGSGGDVANYFSNENQSHASSVGFYIADGIYRGKHGRSLKLDGVDAGFNDNARSRAIVVHAAPYVSQGTINQLGRLGHSEGCPAVSPKVVSKVISNMKGRTVLFINGNDSSYTSKYLDENLAADFAYPDSNAGVRGTNM